MAGDTILTIVGNLGGDVDLRFTPSGKAVANFSVGSTPRTFDKQSNDWRDGETLWMRCSAWGQLAENAAESLQRGMRVVVVGRLRQRSWEKDGEKRTAVEMEADSIGPDLRNATARVTKAERSNGGGGAGRAQDDPWASAGAASNADPIPF